MRLMPSNSNARHEFEHSIASDQQATLQPRLPTTGDIPISDRIPIPQPQSPPPNSQSAMSTNSNISKRSGG
ncbi:hypothetical protein DENSPDRAFT_839460 [Dentipellis sp. KUC8613]|nr:hypothetical protein DENSPDRAFT_839460 [Dentipellis sp. KUC8613]